MENVKSIEKTIKQETKHDLIEFPSISPKIELFFNRNNNYI